MKNKKIKLESLSAESLVALAKESHEKVMKEAELREKKHKERVAALTEKEKGLKEEIATGKEQLEKMISEFEVIEKEQKEAILAEIKESEMTIDDVKSGKITLTQFHAQGMKDEEIKKTAMARTVETLEKISDSIRSKATDLTRLELELYATQSNIYGLLTYPVKSLRHSYRSLGDMLDYQLEGWTKGGHSAQSLKAQKENELMLIEREMSVNSTGHIWRDINLQEAYRLRLDPILPKKLVVSLLEELDGIEGGEKTRLTITYHHSGSYWPGDPITIMVDEE